MAKVELRAVSVPHRTMQPHSNLECDILVYGGAIAGVAAAIAAARAGCRTLLVERGNHIGGMTASGLGSIDTLRDNAFGGIFHEFLGRVREYYFQTYGKDSDQYRLTYGGFFMEPHVAENILMEMVANEKNLQTRHRLELLEAIKAEHTVIGSTYRHRDTGEALRVSHRVAIDGTYEGDFAAAAGVACRVGREGRREYDEQFAGVIYYDWRHHRREILPQSTGEPSPFIQANCFRLTVSGDPSKRLPIPKPDGYAELRAYYRDLLDDFASGRARFLRDILWLTPLANEKYCINGHVEALTSMDLAEHSAEWAVGDWATRDRLFQHYKDYTLGLLYFLQNDPGVPLLPREDARSLGLPPDEYLNDGHFPWQLYVRQGRRIVGEYVITEHDSRRRPDRDRPPTHRDAIATYEHSFDSHASRHRNSPGAIAKTKDGFELIEGVFYLRSRDPLKAVNRPAAIPYCAIVPEKVDGLLVPGALSATSVAYSAIRMEPAWMATGQAAGVAAAQAIAENVNVRAIDVGRLQQTLVEQGQVLVYFRDLALDDPDFQEIQLAALGADLHSFDVSELRKSDAVHLVLAR
jgi:hypothetical protein